GVPDPETELRYVMDAVRLIRRELNERVPLIGFSGSPWTLACYMIEGEGSSSFARAKALALDDPKLMHQLLDTIAQSVASYLTAQAAAGAQALMVFDTWGGLLAPAQFREFSLRYLAAIAKRVKAHSATRDVPLTLFSKGANGHLEALADTGCDALGVDWTIDIGDARRRVGDKVALQGNLDPATLAASPDAIRTEARAVLDAFGAHPGHIFNLGHGITPDINPDNVAVLVDAVHEFSRRSV
ncbi:MAG: uroporphyrinogen decarboxylase family protein, partial [Dokdonella sp.]